LWPSETNILAVSNPMPSVDPVIRMAFCIIFSPLFSEVWQYVLGQTFQRCLDIRLNLFET
jgi:hypothetical protein